MREIPGALPGNASLIAEAARTPLAMPVLALGGDTVGDALRRQLTRVSSDLRGEVLPGCGHIIPADAPAALVERLERFLADAWPADGS